MSIDPTYKEIWERAGRTPPPLRDAIYHEALDKKLAWFRTSHQASRMDGVVLSVSERVDDEGNIFEGVAIIRHPHASTWELMQGGYTTWWPTMAKAIAGVDATWPLVSPEEIP